MSPSGFDTVALCARSFLSNGDDDRLQQPWDWIEVERAADRHSITPVAAYALKKWGGVVPQGVRERLNQRLHSAAHRNLIWLAEWRRALLALETANIPVISLKGPAFALLAYGNIALRESTDLDLLVRTSDVLSARDALIREGYQLRFSAPDDTAFLRSRNCQLDFVHRERGTAIDLHWSALHKMFPFQLPMDALFASARTEQVEGISFLSLSPEHLLLYLCAHGTKHCWQQMRWLCDVACHVQTAQKPDWELCIRQAEAANCGLVLKHSLLLAERVLGLELPAAIKIYCDDTRARMLANTASSFLSGEDDPLSHREALRYHLAFTVGWRDRMRFVLERIFVPEEQDWQEMRLPHPLRFVYYAVRPMRFMLARLAGAANPVKGQSA